MRNTLIAALAITALASCTQSKEEMITGKWLAVQVDNPQQDQLLKEQDAFIDTFGKNTDAATNLAMYGFSNVDSARESLRAEFKDYKDMQKHAIENTLFDFRKDHTIVFNFSGQTDSAKWALEKDGKLTIDDSKMKAKGNIIKMDVITLTKDSLKLKFNDQGGTSTVTFRHDKK